MDLANINRIMKSRLWEKMTDNSNYLSYHIVHTNENNKSHWCALWVFFTYQISDEKLLEYYKEGRGLVRNESLDTWDLPIKVYGKVIVFS